jgi:hypothetical protein
MVAKAKAQERGFEHTVAPKRPLLTDTPREMLATHRTLDRLIKKCGAQVPWEEQERKVAVDLSYVTDIDPGAVLLMIYAGRQVGLRGRTLYVIADDDGPGANAMRKLNKNLQHLRLTTREDRDAFPRDEGEYPLREVKDQDKMVEELEDWARTVKTDTNAKPEDVAVWEMQIGEVVTNSFQHGPRIIGPIKVAPVVMLCGGLINNRVQLAALDMGHGIPRVVERVADERVKSRGDGALIKHACKMGVTSKSTPQNQGYGLPHLLKSVKRNGGSLQIFSQRGLVHQTPRSFRTHPMAGTDRRLDGTLTIVSLCV